MPCDTSTLPNQTLTERKIEVREALSRLQAQLAAGKVKAVIGPQGAIMFQGWNDRSRVTDACAYRLIMATGTQAAKLAITKAEQLAGRTVSRQALAAGWHSHGGGTWHKGH